MKKRSLAVVLIMVVVLSSFLAACGNKSSKSDDAKKDDKFTVAMVTDQGGVDDRSFNQSAWDGLQKFGKDNGLEKGKSGYDYFQSANEADYKTNLNSAIRSNFDLVFGVGFQLTKAVTETAKQQKAAHFALIDDVVEGVDNIASIRFADNEGAFLMGVIAGLTTKTNHVGFIGGMEGEVVGRFEAGFKAGVKEINPKAKIDVKYVGSFVQADKGQQIAATMYSNDADIILSAAGASGNGAFTEARNLKKEDSSREIWFMGVDRDQADQGEVKVDGKTFNVALASQIKRVDIAVEETSKLAKDGKFPGGKTIVYGLDKDAVGIADSTDNIDKKVLDKVKEYKEKIISGDVKVPEKP
ncbi:BMP family lipoprotein [Brochothrix thermosphacta]|uniref:BMP family lipoprotein n=1 Tax=Brochothrix thermosphacta TaxID=2756 RepID=UPI000D7A1602|nr:BMP family protein [Brochothrix thermosphacta]SPN75273.1 lipoprotein involved in guanosine transport [Brochothrix thermosphacta]